MATSSESVAGDALGQQQRQRLLLSIASRGSSEAAALVIPGIVAWLHHRETGAASIPLMLWWLAMAAMALGFVRLRRQLRADLAGPVSSPVQREQALGHWERMLARMALLNGGMWALSIALTQGGGHEFRLFIYLVLCGVVASAATFLAPAATMFWCFFAALFGPMLAAVLWYFPHKGVYLLPLMLLYGATIARHAWGARQLMLQQWAQERDRQQLAERYRQAKEQAEQALAAKSRFLSAASHDLRQPLHALGLLVETARQRNADDALGGLLDEVQSCARSLGTMCNDLLDLSRLESGQWDMRPDVVDLRALFAHAARLFAPEAQQRGLSLRWRVAGGRSSQVMADEVLLRQMVFNLLHNALRYTSSGGVLLAARLRGGGWRIEVRDTGQGIAAEDRPHVFAPHFRATPQRAAGAAAQPGSAGQGLGLAVVAAAARCMDMGHGLLSTPGRGSCFWLQLPPQMGVQAPPPVAPALALPDAAGPLALRGACWVVDGSPQAASALAGLLEGWGLQVVQARSAVTARTWLADGLRPDLLLCDLQLPGGASALELLQAVLDEAPQAVTVLMGAEPAPELLHQVQEEGYLLLRKPVDPRVLQAVLQRSLVQA
ncbi:MAG: hybrid sensor histidine kinase/response regulator [Burkholderiaceae bacterium]|jgi:signal transduction histidine kinase/CheY-like chemotaxis protein|nr:hybrid sensor histidine kinase/response regulator [Burkholderiaceae bacterium]